MKTYKYIIKNISVCCLSFFLLAGFVSATTYEMSYYSDGKDHFYSPTIYLTTGGTHTFFVNGVPWGTFNYAGYKDTGSGYSEIWSDKTTTGYDPSFSTYVAGGNKVKLVIWDGNWNVKSVYYWYIYSDTTPPTNPTSWGGSPSVNTWTTDNTIEVTWSGASDNVGLKGYYYKWDTSSTTALSTSDTYISTSSGSGSRTSSALADGASYYFHIRYMDTSNKLATSTAHRGPFKIDRTDPNPPSLSSPSNGSNVTTLRPTLNWSGSDNLSGIDEYHLKVIEDWGLYIDIVDKDVSDTSYTLTSTEGSKMQWGNRYVWRLYAIDNAGNEGSYSVEWKFTVVDNVKPNNPTNYSSSPSTNTWTTDNTVNVSWSGASDSGSGIDGYSILWNNSSSSTPDTTKDTTGTSITSSGLSDGTWYLHVRAVDKAENWADGALHCGPFIIDRTPPSIPTLQTPANGSSTSDQTPYFNWTDSSDSGSGVKNYNIEIYDWDVTWGDISATTISSDYTPTQNIPYDKIYWKVRATDNAGNTSSYSSEWWFDLMNHPPTQPGTLSAANITKNSARVSWGASTDQDEDTITYEVQYGRTDVIDGWTSAGTTTSTYKDLSNLLADTRYTIRVIARDGKGGESSWRETSALFRTLKVSVISAYWWAPLTVTEGTTATMCAEVEGFDIGTTFDFEIREDNGLLGSTYVTTKSGTVYSESGKYYVKAEWKTQWISEDGDGPEFYFIVSNGSYSKTSSKADADELHVNQKFTISTAAAKIDGSTGPVEVDFGTMATGSGNIVGTGSGTVVYHWEYTSPDNSYWTRIGSLDSTVSMTNGQATIPTTNLIAFNPAGSYAFKIVTTSPSQIISNIVNVATKNRPPEQPGRLWIQDLTHNSVTIHWGPSTDPDGNNDIAYYEFQISEDTWYSWGEIYQTLPTNTNILNLKSNKGYDFRVRAVDRKSAKSDWREGPDSITTSFFTTNEFEAMTPTYDKQDNKFDFSSGQSTSDTSIGDRIPIILVHGMSGDRKPATLNYWYWWVENNSEAYFNAGRYAGLFKVYRFVYDSSDHIGNNGQKLADFVNNECPELEDKQIIIMAHSMGGLVCRYAMNADEAFRNKVLKLITLGTPHLGSPGANPTWAYYTLNSWEWWDTLVYSTGFGGWSPGEYDLAWYNPQEVPLAAFFENYRTEALNHHPCKEELLNNAMSSPFTGSEIMTDDISDAKILAFGGYHGNFDVPGLLDELDPSSQMYAETHFDLSFLSKSDHWALDEAHDAMVQISKSNGNKFLKNDGLVPLESALFETHDVEYVNITDDAFPDTTYIDHSSFLDGVNVDGNGANVMDFIMSYIWDIAFPPANIAEVTYFGPPTGILQRSTQATSIVKVKNTGTASRSFWVGLSFSHQNAAPWPGYGWYDVPPLATPVLQPTAEATIIFNYDIPVWLPSGSYSAHTAVWDGYDRTNHLMTPYDQPFDRQEAESFSLPSFSSPLGSLTDQLFNAATNFKSFRTFEQEVWSKYDEGHKVLFFFSGPSAISIIGGDILGGVIGIDDPTIVIDLADLFGITPEGQNGKVTVWVDGTNSISWSAPVAFGLMEHSFESANNADVRDSLSYGCGAGGIAAIFPWEIQAEYVVGSGWEKRLDWVRKFDVNIGCSQTKEGLRRVELDRNNLIAALNQAWDSLSVSALGTNGLQILVDRLFENIDLIDSWVLGTDDDGNWKPDTPTNLWPENGALEISTGAVLWGSPYHDKDGDPLLNAHFQIDKDSSFGSPIYDGYNMDDTIELRSGFLNYNTQYYWRTCYQDWRGAWSNWSTPTSFTTLSNGEISLVLNISKNWLYQNVPGSTNSMITLSTAGISDPMNNSSYTYTWQVLSPQDVSTSPSIVNGGGAIDNSIALAAPPCSIGSGLSNAALPYKVKLTIIGNQYGNTGSKESEFYICLLGDVNNDAVVDVADRAIINAFIKTGVAGNFTVLDCDLNGDGVVDVSDRAIVVAICKGVLGRNSFGIPCPIR